MCVVGVKIGRVTLISLKNKVLKKTDLILGYVSNQLVKKLFDIYNALEPQEKQVTNTYFIYDPIENKKVDTFNTIITAQNQASKLSDSFKQEITKNFRFDLLHHLHIIEYLENSKLDFHDHSANEHYSYIVYMDNHGGTEFKLDDGLLFVPSEKCKLVIFPSGIYHKAVIDSTHRIVAAGGIFKKNYAT